MIRLRLARRFGQREVTHQIVCAGATLIDLARVTWAEANGLIISGNGFLIAPGGTSRLTESAVGQYVQRIQFNIASRRGDRRVRVAHVSGKVTVGAQHPRISGCKRQSALVLFCCACKIEKSVFQHFTERCVPVAELRRQGNCVACVSPCARKRILWGFNQEVTSTHFCSGSSGVCKSEVRIRAKGFGVRIYCRAGLRRAVRGGGSELRAAQIRVKRGWIACSA